MDADRTLTSRSRSRSQLAGQVSVHPLAHVQGRNPLAEQEDELDVGRLGRHVPGTDGTSSVEELSRLVADQVDTGLDALAGNHDRCTSTDQFGDQVEEARFLAGSIAGAVGAHL